MNIIDTDHPAIPGDCLFITFVTADGMRTTFWTKICELRQEHLFPIVKKIPLHTTPPVALTRSYGIRRYVFHRVLADKCSRPHREYEERVE